MKTLIVTLFIALFATLATDAHSAVFNYNTAVVDQNQDSVVIEVSTFESSSVCQQKATQVTIQKPEDLYPSKILALGKISITFERNLKSSCLKMIGPETASIVLRKGFELPAITEGETYIVEINGNELTELLYVK